MLSSWTYKRLKMPWTGPGAWLSCRGMAWGPWTCASPTVLGEVEGDGKGGRVLRCILSRRDRGDLGRSTVAHHFQCGGRLGGLTLGVPADGITGRTGGR